MAEIDWLEALSPRSARAAHHAIRRGLKTLEAYPATGQAISADERKWPIPFGRDGFVAIYRIETDRVVVARLFHSRQDRPAPTLP